MSEEAKELGNEYAMPQHLAVDECGDLQSSDIRGAGLTKREMFAMAAMQGMLANQFYSDFCGGESETDKGYWLVAVKATKHADALLKELANE